METYVIVEGPNSCGVFLKSDLESYKDYMTEAEESVVQEFEAEGFDKARSVYYEWRQKQWDKETAHDELRTTGQSEPTNL